MMETFGGNGKVTLYTVGAMAVFLLATFLVSVYMPGEMVSYVGSSASVLDATSTVPVIPAKVASHIKTPSAVKGVYITACTASQRNLRNRVLNTIAGTQINSIVVDVKDYTGTISYSDTKHAVARGRGCVIDDLPEFLEELHAKNIYAIARVTVFQDPLYASIHPDVAVQSLSRPGEPWRDRSGLAFIDPDFPSYWNYIVSISKEAYGIGFDEINYDYIRFPSDGDMEDVQFAIPSGGTRVQAIKGFFEFLHSEMSAAGIVTSADLFGQTTVSRGDMGIGQVLEVALPYFDYVCPMNYPSHFTSGFMGFTSPAQNPYEVIKSTMMIAVERAVAASSSPTKLRPWLQAFDLGAVYTPDMVHKQIQAVSDAGLDSWLLWDAANKYTRAEL